MEDGQDVMREVREYFPVCIYPAIEIEDEFNSDSNGACSERIERMRSNSPSRDTHPGLREACLRGLEDIGQILLGKEEGINSPDHKGRTPLPISARRGRIGMVRLLDKGADVETTTIRDWTPLHAAAYDGHTEIGLMLLEKGAQIDVPKIDGTP